MNEAAAGSGCTLLHVPRFLRPARLRTPLLGYGSPHLSARGTSTLLNNALLSARFLFADHTPTLALTSVSSRRCHASTCLRMGSKFRCMRSTPTEHEASDDVNATMNGAISMSSARQKLLWCMAVVLANGDHFEELSARLVAGGTSGEEVALTKADLTNLSKLVEIGLFILKDQLESGFSSVTKEA